jgi:large subunit ribosomal protein L25
VWWYCKIVKNIYNNPTMLKLMIQKREGGKTVEDAKIPAVFYGPKAESTPIWVNEIELLKVWKEAGESTVVTLSLDGVDHDTLIHDIDREPVKGKIRHVDFYVLEKGKKVEIAIPLEFVGVSEAVKTLGGNLVKVLHEIEIEAMPKDLPHNIEVDISSLVDFDSQIHAKDIKLPAGVTLKTEEDEVVALVAEAKEEAEEAPAEIDMSAIEVTDKKGKKEEDGEDAE